MHDTRQVVDRARRGQPFIVPSYGEEQVAILDAIDYRLLQALAAYRVFPSRSAAASGDAMDPKGLDINGVKQMLKSATDDDLQLVWNMVVAAYLVGDISFGRAPEMLHLSRFELQQRFVRLNLPMQSGPTDPSEAKEDVIALRGGIL